MNRKGAFIILLLAFTILLAGGSIGYFQSKHDSGTVDNESITPVVKYEYYLENNLVTKDDITNTEISSVSTTENNKKYIFSSFSCTNEITGEFNNDLWEFEPTIVKDGICKLYFNKAYYDVTLTISNGELAEGTNTNIEREKDGVFSISPYEGYEFDSRSCSNNKDASWDATTNKLTINAIMEDVACKIVFKVKNLKMNLTVENGKGNTTETVEYGKSISTVVEANTGYEYKELICTNNQVAKFANNTVSIEKLTDNTDCKLTYSQVKLEEFSLEIKTKPDTINIITGSTKQSITKGSEGAFSLKAIDGYAINTVVCTVTPSSLTNNNDGSTTYKFLNMSKDISCDITAKEE